jgi:hypothetical protein
MGSSMSLHIKGGASFPAVIGMLTVTTPLASLTADGHGVALDLRFASMKRINRRLIEPPPASGEPCWAAKWDEIASVDVAPRSLVFHLKRGRGSRFVVLRGAVLAPLVREIAGHGVPTRRVRGTTRWFFRRDAWAAGGERP